MVKDAVVLVWSLAARALSTTAAACNARADTPATRASALRSVAVASSTPDSGGPFRLQAGDAIVGRARKGEAGFRGLELGCGRLHALIGGKRRGACGASGGGEIAAVERDERLACADPIAWRGRDSRTGARMAR